MHGPGLGRVGQVESVSILLTVLVGAAVLIYATLLALLPDARTLSWVPRPSGRLARLAMWFAAFAGAAVLIHASVIAFFLMRCALYCEG